jgi:hypothetical protein
LSRTDDERIAYLAGEAVGSLSAEERAELDELREILRETSTWAEPDAGLEDRIVAAIAAEAGARATEPEFQAEPAKPTRHRRRAFSPGSRFCRPRYALGGAAVALAVAALAIVLATGGKSSPKPLHFAMVVTGAQLAPRAKGTASLTKTDSGWRIELSATGLPQIDNGRYYQAWLKNAAGILVPVGTFNDAKRVTLWSGVPVTKFRTLTVTIQTADGNPISSGKLVLIGRIAPRG